MASYEIQIERPKPGPDVLNYNVMPRMRAVVWRIDIVGGTPRKVGARTVKAWTVAKATERAEALGRKIVAADKERRIKRMKENIASRKTRVNRTQEDS